MAQTVLDTLVVTVNADTRGLTQNLQKAQSDLTLLNTAGQAATKGLASAFDQFAKTGKLSFDSLKQIALKALADIASAALKSGLNSLFGGGGKSSGGGLFSSLLNAGLSLFGLSGRAGGGPVTSGQPYVVGERGPELFIPQGAGSIQPNGGSGNQPVNITVNVSGSAAEPAAMARSAQQVAAAVRRSLDQAGRLA